MLQFLGILGGVVLVIGSAWPSTKDLHHPLMSIKNWLLFLGAIFLFGFAFIDFLSGTGTVLFVLLEGLAIVASILMMLDTNDRLDAALLSISTLALIGLSFWMNTSLETLWFIIGLLGVGIGYALTPSIWRDTSFIIGSLMLTYFSYLGSNWIFFWLNLFFALFSGYYVLKQVAGSR